jgi:hypothetical protein
VIALSRQGVRIGTGRCDRERWILLEGPRPRRLLLDAGPEGRLDLVLWDEDGQVHVVLDGLAAEGCGEEGSGAAWIPLGGPFAAPPLALRDGQGLLQLFALDEQGLLRCRPVDREPRDWRTIGGPFRGTLVGWAPVDGPLTLAAEDGDGRFWVCTAAGEAWRPFSAGHRHLVAGFGDAIGDGRLVAADDDDALWVRRLDAESPWEPLGSLEESPAESPAEPHQTPPPATPCSDQAG